MSVVPKKEAFLAAFKACANVSKAAAAVGIERGLHYRWLKDDPTYPAEFRQAVLEAAQFLEDQAVERATDGWEEPVIYQGQLAVEPVLDVEGRQIFVPAVDELGNPILLENGEPRMDRLTTPLTVRKRSDSLLQTLLKAWLPQKYRENHKIEHSGPDGGPIPVQPGLAKLTDEQLAQLTELTRILAESGRAGGGEAPEGPEQDHEVLPG